MKKIPMTMVLLFNFFLSYAQNGLEKIIVEKYYITDANDASANGTDGILPVNSTTYRIYVDMLPGYKFQAAYGVEKHELRIATSTTFFNNEDRGSTTPSYTKNQAKNNTVMLDSWLSVGAACVGQVGVLKSDDDGVSTIVNSAGLLKNNDPMAGIPLTSQDGMRAGVTQQVTTVGITKEMAMFDNQNDGTNGPVFSTTNGSWASLNGSTGFDSLDNKVLIAQITTDGKFEFELNIQISTPSLGFERYVARNPEGNEKSIASLIYPNVVDAKNIDVSNPTIHVYPNPTTNLINISMDHIKSVHNQYQIYDAKSTLLTQGVLESQSSKVKQNINMSNLPMGLYFLVLTLDGERIVKKVVRLN